MDRERGWGRAGETFRATEELRRVDADGAWFGLGDLDLATHLFRAGMLASGRALSDATAAWARRLGIRARILPMSDDPATTRIEIVDERGDVHDLHFQEYWVQRGAADAVKGVRFEGASTASPAPGALAAVADADAVLLCPSNPIVSLDPILAVPGIRDAVRARRDRTAGVSPIVGGSPLRGMADKLMPVVGVEVSAAGVADHYRDLLGGWVVDSVDSSAVDRIRSLGIRVTVTDTVMVDDSVAAAVASAALTAASGGG
jgi:LPPG:FO 2-phospho-L-lactate transferase